MFADLPADDVLRQAELGDAVDQHAADLVQRLEDGDVVALLDEVAGGGEAGGAAADEATFLPVAGARGGRPSSPELALPVGDEALEVADAPGARTSCP